MNLAIAESINKPDMSLKPDKALSNNKIINYSLGLHHLNAGETILLMYFTAIDIQIVFSCSFYQLNSSIYDASNKKARKSLEMQCMDAEAVQDKIVGRMRWWTICFISTVEVAQIMSLVCKYFERNI